MRHLAVCFLVCGIALPVFAEGEGVPTQPNDPGAAYKPCPTCPTCPAPPATVEKQVLPHPFYVTDWQRLAELTREDNRVFPLADAYAKKLDNAYIVSGIGITLGGGVALLNTLSRLMNDHWTTNTKWGLAGGLSATVLSALMGWTMAPSHDDFYTVVNTWNMRNPTHLLAP